jgi:hypothetical protein
MGQRFDNIRQKIMDFCLWVKNRIFLIQKKNIYLSAIIILIIIGLFLISYRVIDPNFDSMVFLSGLSTYVIALFTATYAYTSSRQVDVMMKQVDVMTSQISEMRRDRELQSQPMPWLESLEFVVYKPDFFYSPPVDEYSTHSQCDFFFVLKNVGTTPAISIDVQGRIVLPNKDKSIILGPDTEKIEVLEQGQKHPVQPEVIENNTRARDNKASLFFNDDKQKKVLEYLLDRELENAPILQNRTVFRNIVGAKFLILQSYLLYVDNDEDLKILKNWICEINSFPVNFKDEISEMQRIKRLDEEKWDNLYGACRTKFEHSLVGDEIVITCHLLPRSIKVSPITDQAYEEIMKESTYGVPSKLVCKQCRSCNPNGCSKA